MKSIWSVTGVPLLLAGVLLAGCETRNAASQRAGAPYETWADYLGDPGRSHFSTLDGFTPENVGSLTVAWEHELPDSGQMQMNPIIVDSILYGVTAAQRAFALDARTGASLWVFGASLQQAQATSRGLSYWADGDDKRVLFTVGSDLFALNALTGEPIPSFGINGKIDLRSGMPGTARSKFVISNTPGTVHKDLIIMPLRVAESAGAAPGDIMAFSVRTGKLEWVFHTIPHPGEKGYETWEDPQAYLNKKVGGANNWAGMALDTESETLYVPTGSAAPDFYGGDRKGQNLFANSLLALDANTGAYKWHYQLVHHDLWDRDPPAPPNLISVWRDGKEIPAVAQITKQGYVFLFDRVTGEPLFDIEERPFPESPLPEESAWPTQPIPNKPKPFARQAHLLDTSDLSPFAPNREELKTLFSSADRREYRPPGTDPVLLLPGYDGGAEWGGAGADPQQGILYVNSNEMPWFLQMTPAGDVASGTPGQAVYDKYCVICHQPDRSGVPASGYPSLLELDRRKSREEIELLLLRGKGMMPGFPQLSASEKQNLMRFLLNQEEDKSEVSMAPGTGEPAVPYRHTGYHKFLDANGLPAIAPPWGTLHAIDMNAGEYLWSIPLGDTPGLTARGNTPTGTENYGGPVITENGLLFIAATKDGYFRAFDRHTGRLLWDYKLPAPAFATPALYEVDGIQYIALACGGEKLGTDKGNKILSFTLKL
jgi:quinoprotein glucose dehydrogenase